MELRSYTQPPKDLDTMRHECAESAAEEAIDCLYTTFWAHSFNADVLRVTLISIMYLGLTDALPVSVGLDEEEIEAA